MNRTHDIYIQRIEPLISPRELKEFHPLTDAARTTTLTGRKEVESILSRKDNRMLAVVGPCSIHDERAALEYAERLKGAADRVKDSIVVVMRVYFEKPRTTVGWKGLINDPHLDGTFDIETGIRKARDILLKINEMGLPVGTEMLDPITPQYTADLVTWASIGARTTESQTHRQMASGLSMPIGFKNGTDGNVQVALDAMQASRSPHAFLGMDADGRSSVFHTMGNPYAHLILRGGRSGANYDAKSLARSAEKLEACGLMPNMLIDCSHANSDKDYRNQPKVWRDAIRQRVAGNANIVGMMLESNLFAGNQNLGDDPAALQYGKSITDSCIDWETTEDLLIEAHETLESAGAALAAK